MRDVCRTWPHHTPVHPLLQGEYLAKRGHYAAARSLLSRARAHAADCGNREAEARCLLALSRAELAARNPAEAVALVQVGMGMGRWGNNQDHLVCCKAQAQRHREYCQGWDMRPCV